MNRKQIALCILEGIGWAVLAILPLVGVCAIVAPWELTTNFKEEGNLKTKHYELTEIEILAIREALDTQWYQIKDKDMISPIFKDMKKATLILLDQFKQDYSKV